MHVSVWEKVLACSLLQRQSGSEWLCGLWLQSINRRSDWLRLLVAGPMLLPCKQRSSGIIIAYFQHGILQISSYWVPRLHASEPGYCSSGGLPCWHWHWSRWSLVFCLWLRHFQQWHGFIVRYTMWINLYTETICRASMPCFFIKKEINSEGRERVQSSVGVQFFFLSAIK